jgi:hypothetical protein
VQEIRVAPAYMGRKRFFQMLSLQVSRGFSPPTIFSRTR